MATQPWFLALPPVGNGTATPAQAVGTDAPWAAPIATVVRDPADGAAPAATLRGGYQAEVVDARSKGDVVALSAIPRPRPSTGGSLLISIDLPGEATELGLELRPSRIAAAWLVWLAVTFAVLAFWLPGSARRLRRDGSSKPSR